MIDGMLSSIRSTPGPAKAPAQEDFGKDVAMLAAITYTIFLAIVITPMLTDGDSGWHIAAGRWMIEHRSIPISDPFSFTYSGEKWVPHEWLSEILMALAYAGAGWSGIVLLFAAATTALFLILGLELRRWLPSLPAFIVLLAVFVVLRPYLFARPHMLALPFLAGWTVALLRAREKKCAPLWPLAAIMLLWANMHGSFLFGLALIVPLAVEALIEARNRRFDVLVAWGGFALCSLVAALITPHGVEGLLFPIQVSSMKTLPLILEWRDADFSGLSGFELVLLGLLFFGFFTGLRIPAIRLLMLVGLLHLGLQHIRHQIIFAVVGALLLAEPIGRVLRPKTRLPKAGFRAELAGQWLTYRPGAIAMFVLIAAITSVRLAVPVERLDSRHVPTTAIARLPQSLRTQRVFNDYGFGGALILAGVRPYIDGRADMYGDAFVKQYADIAGGNVRAWRDAAHRWDIRWTFLAADAGLIAVLDRDPQWRRIYSDKTAVIHIRREGRP